MIAFTNRIARLVEAPARPRAPIVWLIVLGLLGGFALGWLITGRH